MVFALSFRLPELGYAWRPKALGLQHQHVSLGNCVEPFIQMYAVYWAMYIVHCMG
jgi:hypothetical protein